MNTPVYRDFPNQGSMEFLFRQDGVDIWYDPDDAGVPYYLITGDQATWVSSHYRPCWATPKAELYWEPILVTITPYLQAHHALCVP